jgi:hypothetical protein
MNNVLNAVKRLSWDDPVEGSVELDARFDKGREADLKKIQGYLRSNGLLFSMRDGALFHRTSGSDIEWHAHTVISLMNSFGCGLIVQQRTMRNHIWALSGRGGITLQRLRSELRIFYTC